MSNSPYPTKIKKTFINAIQPRLQCNNNAGYCGETSMISAVINGGDCHIINEWI